MLSMVKASVVGQTVSQVAANGPEQECILLLPALAALLRKLGAESSDIKVSSDRSAAAFDA